MTIQRSWFLSPACRVTLLICAHAALASIRRAARLLGNDLEYPIIEVVSVRRQRMLMKHWLLTILVAWTLFWHANKSKSYCEWMIDAAGQHIPVLAYNALSHLSTCRKSRAATAYLATRVQRDRGDARHLAALSLAEHRDNRAIPVLIDMLASDNQSLRARALVALANFRNTTLGYDPEGDDASRAAALRRWRAWASVPAPKK